ncbi:ciliary-associated calcium-binding coiled-coil protein 1-like isoform X2 [Babylonia areolata]|uniref:ciliary-associated calcium-binding coiled-coil protein 1-like isoform X2 n=1 Tax=Babylonia areolata TaxID=304850 RepID=UPI003FD1FEFF
MSKPRGKSNTRGKERQPKDKQEEVDRNEGALAYQVLPQDVSKQLLEMDVDDMQERLCEFFKLNDSPTDLQEAAILDYYTSAVWWAKEQGFTEQQMSGFFTAVHTLLDNVKDKQMTLVDNVLELKKMLVGIGSDGASGLPSGGMEFFDEAQGQAVTSYISNSLFQHYGLYEYMFCNKQDEEIIGTDLDLEVAKAASLPFPPPLDEGIEEDKYEAFVKTPPPSPPEPEPQEGAAKEGEQADKETADIDLDADVFTELSAQDVKEVVESVAAEMLGGLQNDVAIKLREKENAVLAKINKIYHVAAN